MKYVVAFVLCMSSVVTAAPGQHYVGKDRVGWGNNQPGEFFQELWGYVTRGHGRYNNKWGFDAPDNDNQSGNDNDDRGSDCPNPNHNPNPNPNPNPVPPGTAPAPEPGTMLALGVSALVISLSKRLRRKSQIV